MAERQPLTCVRCWHAPASRLLVVRWREETLRLLCTECAVKDEADAPGLPGFRSLTVLAVAPVLTESQRFQVGDARDVLGTWDLNSPGGISRETVLADQVRALLAIVDGAFPAEAEASHG